MCLVETSVKGSPVVAQSKEMTTDVNIPPLRARALTHNYL